MLEICWHRCSLQAVLCSSKATLAFHRHLRMCYRVRAMFEKQCRAWHIACCGGRCDRTTCIYVYHTDGKTPRRASAEETRARNFVRNTHRSSKVRCCDAVVLSCVFLFNAKVQAMVFSMFLRLPARLLGNSVDAQLHTRLCALKV